MQILFAREFLWEFSQLFFFLKKNFLFLVERFHTCFFKESRVFTLKRLFSVFRWSCKDFLIFQLYLDKEGKFRRRSEENWKFSSRYYLHSIDLPSGSAKFTKEFFPLTLHCWLSGHLFYSYVEYVGHKSVAFCFMFFSLDECREGTFECMKKSLLKIFLVYFCWLFFAVWVFIFE
jgi:hypothetical protein